MARKEVVVTLQDGEESLTFRIRQMPATKLESWLIRAGLLLASSGLVVPDGADLKQAGAALMSKGTASLSGLSLDYEKGKPLLDDLLHCCHRVLENGTELAVTENVADGFITDVRTLFKLRLESLKVNLDFFDFAALSTFLNPSKTAGEATPTS